jgi:hypothetical protein
MSRLRWIDMQMKKFIIMIFLISASSISFVEVVIASPLAHASQTQPIFGRWNIEGVDTEYPDGNRPKPSNPSSNSFKITYYYLPVESHTGTADGYGWPENYGTSNTPTELKCTNGSKQTVDHAFARAISCEGSGITKDGIALNIQTSSSKCSGMVSCFYQLGPNCPNGMGAWQVPLIPYRTIASTNGLHMGDEVYIDVFRGKVMPNGMVHDGYFAVADYCGSCSDMNHFDIFIAKYDYLDEFNNIVPSNNETPGQLTGAKYSIEFEDGHCVTSGDCKNPSN